MAVLIYNIADRLNLHEQYYSLQEPKKKVNKSAQCRHVATTKHRYHLTKGEKSPPDFSHT